MQSASCPLSPLQLYAFFSLRFFFPIFYFYLWASEWRHPIQINDSLIAVDGPYLVCTSLNQIIQQQKKPVKTEPNKCDEHKHSHYLLVAHRGNGKPKTMVKLKSMLMLLFFALLFLSFFLMKWLSERIDNDHIQNKWLDRSKYFSLEIIINLNMHANRLWKSGSKNSCLAAWQRKWCISCNRSCLFVNFITNIPKVLLWALRTFWKQSHQIIHCHTVVFIPGQGQFLGFDLKHNRMHWNEELNSSMHSIRAKS